MGMGLGQTSHEFAGFRGKFNPIRFAGAENEPLLHDSSGARLEAFAFVSGYQLVDAFPWELHNELTLRRRHREDSAIHVQCAKAETLPLLPRDVPVLGESLYHGRKARIGFPFGCLFLRTHTHNVAYLRGDLGPVAGFFAGSVDTRSMPRWTHFLSAVSVR